MQSDSPLFSSFLFFSLLSFLPHHPSLFPPAARILLQASVASRKHHALTALRHTLTPTFTDTDTAAAISMVDMNADAVNASAHPELLQPGSAAASLNLGQVSNLLSGWSTWQYVVTFLIGVVVYDQGKETLLAYVPHVPSSLCLSLALFGRRRPSVGFFANGRQPQSCTSGGRALSLDRPSRSP